MSGEDLDRVIDHLVSLLDIGAKSEPGVSSHGKMSR
jgi:hypothetical protein